MRVSLRFESNSLETICNGRANFRSYASKHSVRSPGQKRRFEDARSIVHIQRVVCERNEIMLQRDEGGSMRNKIPKERKKREKNVRVRENIRMLLVDAIYVFRLILNVTNVTNVASRDNR